MSKHKSDSSNIDHIDYFPETKTLEVKFRNGGTYHYAGVDMAAYEEFKAAPSHGKHLAKNIVGKYPHKKQGLQS